MGLRGEVLASHSLVRQTLKSWFISCAIFAQQSPLTHAVYEWSSHWWEQRGSIAMIAGVNVALTTGTEVISRTIAAPLFGNEGREYSFLIADNSGHLHINRHSLINIWMTFFATLLGAPLNYFRNRKRRFLFFTGFGGFNSILGQGLSSWMLDGSFAVGSSRLLFDLGYNATIKFAMFEFFRSHIIRARKCIVRIGKVRVKQDLITSFFKVILLNLLKFRG